MAIFTIEQLQLSVSAHYALLSMGIYYVEDLMNTSILSIAEQPNVGEKTFNEIKEIIEQLSKKKASENADIVKPKEIDNISFSDNQTEKISRHNINELNLSKRSYNALVNAGYLTIDKVINLTTADLSRLKGVGKKSIDDINNRIVEWVNNNDIDTLDMNNENEQNVDGKLKEYLKTLANCLIPIINISWYQLFELLNKNKRINDFVSVKTESINEEVLGIILEIPEIQIKLRNSILLLTKDGIISIEELNDKLNNIQLDFKYDLIINSIYKAGLIKIHRDNYIFVRNTLQEQLNNYGTNNRDQEIFEYRVNGFTLQEIGDTFDITRERVRQICRKIVAKYPLLFEDYFSEVFKYFNLPKKDFIRLFPEITEEGYEYLSIRYKRGKDKVTKKSTDLYKGSWKKRILEYIIEEEIRIDKKSVSKTEIIYRILMSNTDKPLTIDEFEEEYYNYIYLKGYPLERLKINVRTVINHLRTAKGIVFNSDNKVRYCDVNPKILWNSIDFNLYRNLVISSELIFENYKEMMEDLDIRDGYELFYIIKSSLNKWNSKKFKIICRRVPTLVIGNASEKEQAIKLLKEISPIEINTYYTKYEERYGIKKDTAQANPTISNSLLPYYMDGKYIIDAPVFHERDVEKFKSALSKKSIWFIDEVDELFDEICVNSHKDSINTAAFRRIGYIFNAGYVYNDKYGTVTNYFEKEIFSKDVIELSKIDNRLKSLPSFTSVLEKKKNNLQYIEISSKVLYSIKRFELEYDISKDQLIKLQEYLLPYFDIPFFNGHSIWKDVSTNSIVKKLRGNKWLLTCIMRQQEEISSLRVTGGIILSLDRNMLNISNICKWLIDHNKMSLNMLVKEFNNHFGCNVDKYKIAAKLKTEKIWDVLVTDSIDEYIEGLAFDSNLVIDDLFREEFF